MVLFEFESYRQMAKLDVAEYQLETPCDSGRFSARLEAYFNELGFSFVVTAPLLSWYQGELQPDVVIANHLDLLELMPSGVRVQVKNELRQLTERAEDPLHPRRKTLWSTDRPVDLAAALRSSSGPTLSEHLWLPYCRNFGVDDASQIDGRLQPGALIAGSFTNDHRNLAGGLFQESAPLAGVVLGGAGRECTQSITRSV